MQPDGHVLLFTAGVALLTGVLFGLAPAWNAFASAPVSALREMGRAGETRSRRLFGKGLVVAQVTLSVVLLSAAGLFVRHLSNLRNLDLGFQRDHVLLVTLDPARSGYSREQLSRPYQELLGRLEAIPGVRSATISGATPISGAGASRFITVAGHQERPEDRRYVSLNWVAPKYFETLGTPFLAGRDFNFQDQGRSRVAIVNQAMARYYFADGNPIGKHVKLDGDDKPYEIVGMVGDAKYFEIREAAPRTIYFNMFQEGQVFSQFALRTYINPASVVPEVRRTVRESLKTIPVERVTTLADQVDASIVSERLIATIVRVIRRAGVVAYGHRHLRATGVHRGAARQRDRHSYGAGRDTKRCDPAGARRRAGNGLRRLGHRSAHRILEQKLRRQLDPGPAGKERRPDRLRHYSNDCGCAACSLRAGTPCGSRGSHGSAATRVGGTYQLHPFTIPNRESGYSYLSVVIGSTLAARRAGT